MSIRPQYRKKYEMAKASCIRTACLAILMATICIFGGTNAHAASPSIDGKYSVSRVFPGKGKYSDWLAANKLNNQGVRLAQAKKYKEAAAKLRQAIKIYSIDYTFHEHLGGILRETGDLAEAEQATVKATRLAPWRWGPWYNLGLILTAEKQYGRALGALERAKRSKPPQAELAGINRLIAALKRSEEQNSEGQNVER